MPETRQDYKNPPEMTRKEKLDKQEYLNRVSGGIMLEFFYDKRSVQSLAKSYNASEKQIENAIRFFISAYDMPNKKLTRPEPSPEAERAYEYISNTIKSAHADAIDEQVLYKLEEKYPEAEQMEIRVKMLEVMRTHLDTLARHAGIKTGGNEEE